MANSNGIITAPVRVAADVRNVLGETETDLSVLCTSDKINWASIFKPVHIANTLFPDRSGAWWRGTNGDCGITPKRLNIYTEVASVQTSDGKNGWTYTRPFGGTLSPYRIGDFDKYNHNAVFPIVDWICPEKVEVGGKLLASLMYSRVTDETPTKAGSLTLADILIDGVQLSEWKFGVYVINAAGTEVGRVVGDSIGSCQFDCATLRNGLTLTAYPFIARYTMAQGTPNITNSYVSVPYCAPKTFQIVSAGELNGLNISFRTSQKDTTVSYTVTISVTSSSFLIRSGTLTLRFTSSKEGDSLLSGESYIAIPETTISSTSPLVLEGSFPAYSDRSYRLDLYLLTQAGEIRRSTMVMVEAS